ncbi:Heterokaryon incompatibility protein 6, OR allele [Fusarium austroafricanum]|uniref:Heterokaryon incompatibility protein 6, OR allele n=1 Tax=Fusarium austroafricanum TaxID=2364996 RepID=A0A8H4JFV6_9HYPO|nr:Heterokaryon incompatibility protein 6, OR allele [Fusarium austroafricanum]
MLRHLLRRRTCIPLSYSRSTFRRSFHTSHPRWAESSKSTQRTIGQRIATKVKEYTLAFMGLMVFAALVEATPTRDDILDAITRVTGPKTVAYNALSDIPKAVYNPTHQDPAIRQPITRSDEFRVLIVEPGSGDEADDPKERGEQVAKMGSIYKGARRVVIWLGEQTEDVKGAFHTLEEWGKLEWKRSKGLKAEDLDWLAVSNLLKRPWFQRMWILQEAVLGRNPVLVCGFETLPWESLSKCHTNGDLQGIDDGPEMHQAMQAIGTIEHGRAEHHTTHIKIPGRRRGSRQKYTPDFKLVSTLYEARGFQCKDVRDKVFGVLSLATNVSDKDEMLRPNYQAGVEEIFTAVARWEIEKNRSLELLSYCTRKESKHPDLPSWAPDFSDIDDSEAISFLQKRYARPSYKPFYSSLKKEPNTGLERYYQPMFREENGKTVLILSGVMVDTITRVAEVIDDSRMMLQANPDHRDQDTARLNMAEIRKRRAWIEEWVGIALATDPGAACHDKRQSPFRDAIWTLYSFMPQNAVKFWAFPHFGMSQPHWNDFSQALSLNCVRIGGFDIETYVQFLFKGANTKPDQQKHCTTEASYRHLTKIMRYRRFCATATGRMGWVPRSAREGDLVCLLSGAEVPIVLRRMPSEDTTPLYRVVGDAYFDRLMHKRGRLDAWSNSRYYIGGERLCII